MIIRIPTLQASHLGTALTQLLEGRQCFEMSSGLALCAAHTSWILFPKSSLWTHAWFVEQSPAQLAFNQRILSGGRAVRRRILVYRLRLPSPGPSQPSPTRALEHLIPCPIVER